MPHAGEHHRQAQPVGGRNHLARRSPIRPAESPRSRRFSPLPPRRPGTERKHPTRPPFPPAAARLSSRRSSPNPRGSSGRRPRRPSAPRARTRSHSTSRAWRPSRRTPAPSIPLRLARVGSSLRLAARSRRCVSAVCARKPPEMRLHDQRVLGRRHFHQPQVLLRLQNRQRFVGVSPARRSLRRTASPPRCAVSSSTARLNPITPPNAETGSHSNAFR